MALRIILLILVIWNSVAFSQKLEIGLGAGPTYYKGDLQPTLRVLNPKIGTNAFVRYNSNRILSFKANVMFGLIGGNDKKSGNVLNEQRDLSFLNKTLDYNAQVEYNFLNFRTHNGRYERNWTPYLFGGFGQNNPLGTDLNNRGILFHVKGGTNPKKIIFFGVGYKRIWKKKVNFNAELGSRIILGEYNDLFDGFGYRKGNGESQYPAASLDPKFKIPNTLQPDSYMYVSFSFSYLFYKVHCDK